MFPEYSDLGHQTQSYFDQSREQWARYWRYYSGDVFKDTLPEEANLLDENVELFPVGINLVKMMCKAQSDSLFGEWEDSIIRFDLRKDTRSKSADTDAQELAMDILDATQAETLLWEASLDREIYGGSIIRIIPTLSYPYIRWSKIDIDTFYPIWDPEDPDELLEVYQVYSITREQALAKYNFRTEKDTAIVVVHWTLTKYETKIDDISIDSFSGVNPWNIIPFEFIPRMRIKSWYGDALTQDLIRPQDELNLRLADLGDSINYNTHPTRYGRNMPSAFTPENYPLGPNVFWDLGKKITTDQPEVGLLEIKNPLPEGVFKYIEFIYDYGRTMADAPPIAFGEDNGGGQRSGITLEIRLWPLIKATRRSRAYMGGGIMRAMRKSAIILSQKRLPGISSRALDSLIKSRLKPSFFPILPRDTAAIVDEVVKRLSTTPPTISLETAVSKLGDGLAEVDRIEEMVEEQNEEEEKRLREEMKQSATNRTGTSGNNKNEQSERERPRT